MAQSYFIKTFGCQMNVADTERMSALLTESGMEQAHSVDQADVILINGCSVRDKAVHKAISALGTYKELLRNGKKPTIGLGGCVGELDKGKAFKRAPYLDFVFGTDVIDELPEIVGRVQRGDRHSVFTGFKKEEKFSTETKILKQKAQAFVNIMKGCDKYCTYCIVPFTRGREKSRLIDEVLDDLANLVEQGVREVTLLGQNVNSFGKGNPNQKNRSPRTLHNVIGKVGPEEGEENFPQLLWAIENDTRLRKLKRVRFTSSHPLDFSDELIECYAEHGGVTKLCPQLHLPVQSGSDRILQKMGRHHRIADYESQMQRLRTLRPDVALSSDIIVGFPTETESEFEETLALIERMQYDQVFAFSYSERPGTRASKLPDDVSAVEKRRRLNQAIQLQLEISARRNQTKIGQTFEVMVEAPAKSTLAQESKWLSAGTLWSGRTGCGRLVHFAVDSPRSLMGQHLSVRVLEASALALYGEVLPEVLQ